MSETKLTDRVNREWRAMPGKDRLWGWFGLSRASFCVLPRVLMHEMSDEWQGQMADLLEQYEDAFPVQPNLSCTVMAKTGNKFAAWPAWILNYRRPDMAEIENARGPSKPSE